MKRDSEYLDSFVKRSLNRGINSSKAKKKPHKNSCNFDRGNIYDNMDSKLNRSFDDESDNISVTQTKSMKIEI